MLPIFFFCLRRDGWEWSCRALETDYQIAFLESLCWLFPVAREPRVGWAGVGDGAPPLRQLRTLWSTETGTRALFLFCFCMSLI